MGRGGRYTGEDGFELSIPDEAAVELTKAFLENKEARSGSSSRGKAS